MNESGELEIKFPTMDHQSNESKEASTDFETGGVAKTKSKLTLLQSIQNSGLESRPMDSHDRIDLPHFNILSADGTARKQKLINFEEQKRMTFNPKRRAPDTSRNRDRNFDENRISMPEAKFALTHRNNRYMSREEEKANDEVDMINKVQLFNIACHKVNSNMRLSR